MDNLMTAALHHHVMVGGIVVPLITFVEKMREIVILTMTAKQVCHVELTIAHHHLAGVLLWTAATYLLCGRIIVQQHNHVMKMRETVILTMSVKQV